MILSQTTKYYPIFVTNHLELLEEIRIFAPKLQRKMIN